MDIIFLNDLVIQINISTFCFRNYRGSHAGAVNCVRFNEDSSVAISGSIDSSVKCWDLRSKRYYKAIIYFKIIVHGISFSFYSYLF